MQLIFLFISKSFKLF